MDKLTDKFLSALMRIAHFVTSISAGGKLSKKKIRFSKEDSVID
jgi:hypothetical protein